MTVSVLPRLAEQPRYISSSAAGPLAGATLIFVSLFPARGSYGCSTGSVDRRPSTPTQQSHSRIKRAAVVTLEVDSRHAAIETTDALPKNFTFGGDGLLFFVDKLFHRRT